MISAMNKHDVTIGILGLGLSGQATLRAAIALGWRAVLWDDTPAVMEKYADYQSLSAETILSCQCLVAAPGIADTHPLIQTAQAHGIDVICDIELWHRLYPNAHTIGITGTNGKSTLTAMVAHILTQAGRTAYMGGNIGTAVFDLPSPEDHADAIYVLELSSFQIERCPTFRPYYAALLNITPDHLDRHGTLETYAAIKAHLFEGQGKAVIATDDVWTQQIAQMVDVAGARELTRIHNSAAPQEQNERMAIEIVAAFGVDAAQARQALQTYEALPHRQSRVLDHKGVIFIDDSKATNAQATLGALKNFENIIWIVGGQAKDGGLNGLENALQTVRYACVIGADTSEFMTWLAAHDVACIDCGTMEKAVIAAWEQAKLLESATILLSPACASYDQYRNFMQRGQDFIEKSRALIQSK